MKKAGRKPIILIDGKSIVDLPTEMSVAEWATTLAKYGELVAKVAGLGFEIAGVSVGTGAELHLTVKVPWVPSGQ